MFVTAIAHIAMNNAAAALSYFVVVENQLLANLGLTLTMLLAVGIMAAGKMFSLTIDEHPDYSNRATPGHQGSPVH